MKKFLIIIPVLSFCLTGCNNNDNNNQEHAQEPNNYTATRTTSLENTNETNNTTNIDNIANSSTDTINNNNINTETEIASFSTKIYTPDDEARQTNIRITCSKLNETIVRSR